jgi:hypothetical protein
MNTPVLMSNVAPCGMPVMFKMMRLPSWSVPTYVVLNCMPTVTFMVLLPLMMGDDRAIQ